MGIEHSWKLFPAPAQAGIPCKGYRSDRPRPRLDAVAEKSESERSEAVEDCIIVDLTKVVVAVVVERGGVVGAKDSGVAERGWVS